MATKPSFVLVPGAWHLAATWDKVISGLSAHGYKSVAVSLATASDNAAASLRDDVNATRDAIVAETSQGRDVVLVVHSYGSLVGSSAIKGLTKASRPSGESNGTGSVIGFFMIATGFAVTGKTFLDLVGGQPPPIWEMKSDPRFATLTVPPRELFYHDLPEEEGNYWASKIQKQSIKALTEDADVAYAGWKELPVWYLATTDDKTHPLELQRLITKMAIEEGGDVTVREIDSSHSPMLSKPDETVGYLLEAVKVFT